MVQKVAAVVLAFLVFAAPSLAGFELDTDRFTDAKEVLTEQRMQEYLSKIMVDGKPDLELAERELALSTGEEQAFWPFVVAFVAASIKASCENDWSYRDKDRCVGKCDDYDNDGKRK